MIETIERRKQRWLDFYDPQKPPRSLFLIHYLPGLGERPLPREDNITERVDWAWRKYEIMLETMEWLDDDRLPFLDVYCGTEVFSAAFGCQPIYPAVIDMPFALPLVHTVEEAAKIAIPSLESVHVSRLFAIADELKSRAAAIDIADPLIRLPNMLSPIDICAQIWNKVKFYPAMIKSPEAVKELSQKVTDFLAQFLDAWFARYGRSFIAHFPDDYVPKGVTFTIDEAGFVSGKLFKQLIAPGIQFLAERYGGLGIFCSTQAGHQWKNFCDLPNLRMISLHQPPEETRKAWDFFAGAVPQHHGYGGEGPAWTWPDQHPAAARVVYDIFPESKKEALEISRRMRDALQKQPILL